MLAKNRNKIFFFRITSSPCWEIFFRIRSSRIFKRNWNLSRNYKQVNLLLLKRFDLVTETLPHRMTIITLSNIFLTIHHERIFFFFMKRSRSNFQLLYPRIEEQKIFAAVEMFHLISRNPRSINAPLELWTVNYAIQFERDGESRRSFTTIDLVFSSIWMIYVHRFRDFDRTRF